jgi:hypothetical protein
VNFEEMICPECGERFDAAKTKRENSEDKKAPAWGTGAF